MRGYLQTVQMQTLRLFGNTEAGPGEFEHLGLSNLPETFYMLGRAHVVQTVS